MADNYNIEEEEASIVLVGSINPSIFHPEWLYRNELISKDEHKTYSVEIVHNDITKFSLEWLNFVVLRNKMIARTNDASKFYPLRDLMASIFTILEHTPLTALGMNFTINYNIASEEQWHKIGDTLVPKRIWEESLPHRIGLTSLKMQSPRTDDLNGSLNINLSPFYSNFYGVRIQINSHIDLKFKEEEKDKEHDVYTILSESWGSSIELARKIGNKTIEKALE